MKILLNGKERKDAYNTIKRAFKIPKLEPHVYTEAEFEEMRDTIKKMIKDGVVIYPNNIVIGPTIVKMLEEFNPSKIIMGAGGITEEKGVTIYDFIGASYFTKLVKKVDEKIVVSDHSKFGRNVLAQVIPLDEINTIITDGELPPGYIEVFKNLHINCILAKTKK